MSAPSASACKPMKLLARIIFVLGGRRSAARRGEKKGWARYEEVACNKTARRTGERREELRSCGRNENERGQVAGNARGVAKDDGRRGDFRTLANACDSDLRFVRGRFLRVCCTVFVTFGRSLVLSGRVMRHGSFFDTAAAERESRRGGERKQRQQRQKDPGFAVLESSHKKFVGSGLTSSSRLSSAVAF